MTTLRYQPEDYRNLLRMSGRKHLLVEGADDRRFFSLVFDELRTMDYLNFNTNIRIDIDTAENLIQFGEIFGNREKVEEICRSVTGKTYEDKLVGFVDREFREFELNPVLQDKLLKHRIDGRLIWSRGHSIENYFFKFLILRSSLRDTSTSVLFEKALALFENIFEEVLRFACAASLTGYELDKLSLIKGSIKSELFNISSPKITLKFQEWENILIREMNTTQSSAIQIVKTYQLWETNIQSVDLSTLRWVCHGHIGFKTIWEVYSRCLVEISNSLNRKDSKSEARKALVANKDMRFNACASTYSRMIISGQGEYPVEVLQLLGIFNAPDL